MIGADNLQRLLPAPYLRNMGRSNPIPPTEQQTSFSDPAHIPLFIYSQIAVWLIPLIRDY